MNTSGSPVLFDSCRKTVLKDDLLAGIIVRMDMKDLLLIRQRFGDYYGACRNMEEIYDEKNPFSNQVLKKIGEKHEKTFAQTVLRFLLQSGMVLIPKSTHKNRMEENFNIFDFSLTVEWFMSIA